MTVDHEALRDAAPTPYWLDQPDRPDPRAPLDGNATADLLCVGGGYSGLWTALLAKERDPSRDVVLLEGDRIGWAASGRNGGFCAASLTHGEANGAERWPDEFETLQRLGRENLDAIEETLDRYGIDCDFERHGRDHRGDASRTRSSGCATAEADPRRRFLDERRDARRGQLADLPGRRLDRTARPWSIRRGWPGVWPRPPSRSVCASTRARASPGSRAAASGVDVRTASGAVVRARQVALGTNAFPSLRTPPRDSTPCRSTTTR